MKQNLPPKHFIRFCAAACVLWASLFAPSVRGSDLLPPGFRPAPPGIHALVGGTVVVKPGEVLSNATIVIRNGFIQAVGKDAATPADARVWDMKGLTIYAGFIEPYLVLGGSNGPVTTSDSEPIFADSLRSGSTKFFGVAGAQTDMGTPGPGDELSRVTPEHRAVKDYSPNEKDLNPLRQIGFTTALLAPARGIIRGTSALIALSDENPNHVVIKPDVFQHIALDTRGTGEERGFPASLMGVISVVRQRFFDTQHYLLDAADYEKHPQNRRRPDFNPALEALVPAATKKMRVVIEPGSALMVDRAAKIARELGVDYCFVSCGEEWRRPELAKAAATTFLVPLDFPTLPKLPSEEDWDQIQLDQLRRWDWAAENPSLLRQQGLDVCLTTYGLSDKKKFRQNLRQALDRGLAENDALAALTTGPAKLCGVESQLGTIEAGKLAYLTVVDGESYFKPDAKIREVWIDGRVYRSPAEEPKSKPDDSKKPAAEQGNPAKPKEEPEKQAKPPEAAAEKKEPKPEEKASGSEEKPEKKNKNKEQLKELQKSRVARSPLEGRGVVASPKSVLIQGATVWTEGPDGRLENADVLVVGDKIKAVGKSLTAPTEEGLVKIDGKGLHVTPGLIDCHSHSAILGSVNEGTLPSTAMVRIRDVVNSETEHLYQELAGGLTTANLLHGSANPIGGQNCVIKLREGAAPDELIFDAAPQGIKFALGENVKQSNWGDRATTRFPQTRMGVRTFMANRFTAAQTYLAEWDAYNKAKAAGSALPRPPARDLELEAIGEIIQGKRLIHCHSYRQDEILTLLRLMEGFGVKIGSLQHVLEGYKVADEIAAHGAGASTFSDWWAYKFEVYDAIPYNGSIMRERGVVVSFNSDSSELARRLYTESAKAVKYGGTPEVEALKFVTLNPAKQLHIDSRVGSLEAGKDADLAIWSKSPLDSGTVCLQTWIDGKKYFDRALDAERTAKLQKERADLIAKAKKLSKLLAGGGDSGGGGDEGDGSFFRVSLEHEFDGLDRDCMDEVKGGRQ